MHFNHLKSLYLSGLAFVILLFVGFLLSQHKILWNDELYTQQTAIDAHSYDDIIFLKFPDGNKNPLFYIIQKTVCNIFSYHLPVYFPREIYSTRDIPSQTILRISPNIYMSLALALIVYFFARFYSPLAAGYALCVALVSPMVWAYWVEARPYSLWFLLTTAQLLLLCCASLAPRIKTAKHLFFVHILLALTTPASICQLFIAAVMLAIKKQYNKFQLALIFILPMAIALFYYFADAGVRVKTYFFYSNFFDVVMPERVFIYVIYVLVTRVLPEKYKETSRNTFFLPVFLLFLASAFLILFSDLFTVNSQSGFFSRYLIYMVPADVLMYCLASIDLFRWSRRHPWPCMNVSIFLGGLVVIRGLITYRAILAAATYLHSPS